MLHPVRRGLSPLVCSFAAVQRDLFCEITTTTTLHQLPKSQSPRYKTMKLNKIIIACVVAVVFGSALVSAAETNEQIKKLLRSKLRRNVQPLEKTEPSNNLTEFIAAKLSAIEDKIDKLDDKVENVSEYIYDLASSHFDDERYGDEGHYDDEEYYDDEDEHNYGLGDSKGAEGGSAQTKSGKTRTALLCMYQDLIWL